MFVDARTVPEDFLAEADVCVVGAGAAGITIARELRGRPLRVILLESGWLAPDPATQSLYAGEVRDVPYFALESARNRYFGGTTNEWAGECRPLDALDFERRDWVPDSGWPFGLADLLPFYERAQAVCQLGPFAYTPADWARHGVRPIAFPGGNVRSCVLHYSPPTRFGSRYREEIGTARNVVAYLGANAVELETPSPPRRVSAVRVACLAGRRFRVAARVVVLATGGIENARLLLASNRVQPAGLGNPHGLVGRYFMEHLYLDRAATIRAGAGAIGEFYTRGHWSAGRRVRGLLGLTPELQRGEGLTNYCAVVDAPARLLGAPPWRGALRALRERRPPADALARLRRRLVESAAAVGRLGGGEWLIRRYPVKNVMEQAPNPESRVVLTGGRDPLGCPRVALHWRLTALDKRTAHRAHAVLDEALRRAGVGRLQSALGGPEDPWPPGLRGARHHMGTTRMHPDPGRGVVDADGRVHGVANLYLAGSSVFPTSGSANPTLTIVALALRLADHLERVVKAGVPSAP
ncbi:MAG TPA: GMC family oxidoreductase [Methylomirabilota bacterium]|nr:GMC family oxidoreductase [Methylomirabilota bacterium]